MAVQSVTPILHVSSIEQCFAWFRVLGWQPGFAWNGSGMLPPGESSNAFGPATFGSVCCNEAQIFLCVGAQGAKGTMMPKFPGDDETDGVWMSWWMDSVQDVDTLHQIAMDNQFMVTYPPTNEPWGVREFHLRHPDGHMFRISAGFHHTN